MKLEKKKDLAVRTLNIGRNRIIFNINRIADIKEAITKQDIRDLVQDKAITIKLIKGRRKVKKGKKRRKHGSIRKRVSTKKRSYIIMTRKLRSYLAVLKRQNKINIPLFIKLRKEIRSRSLKSLANLKERIKEEQA